LQHVTTTSVCDPFQRHRGLTTSALRHFDFCLAFIAIRLFLQPTAAR
jgi:hypothetical protein